MKSFKASLRGSGVLPRLLREILETRFMVKRAMKSLPPGPALLHCTIHGL